MRYFAFSLFVCLVSAVSCTNVLENEVTEGDKKLVVYGYVHNGAPPYTVEVNRSQFYTSSLNAVIKVSGAEVVLHDGSGATESMEETSPGIYQTCTERIQGTPGQAYWVSVYIPETGDSYTSVREVMPPATEITDLQVEAATRPAFSEAGIPFEQDGYNIRVSFDDSDESSDNYFVKYAGTYEVETSPENNVVGSGGTSSVPDPLPCSGYIYNPAQGLIKVEECTCCVCWVVESFEDPVLLDDARIDGSDVQGLQVTFVPGGIAAPRIGRNYWIGAELRKLTPEAYNYWYTFLRQKNGLGTIFQPILGTLPGNILSEGDAPAALGYFYAASVDTEGIDAGDRIRMIESPIPTDFSCLRYDNSTNVKPDYYPF